MALPNMIKVLQRLLPIARLYRAKSSGNIYIQLVEDEYVEVVFLPRNKAIVSEVVFHTSEGIYKTYEEYGDAYILQLDSLVEYEKFLRKKFFLVEIEGFEENPKSSVNFSAAGG